MAFNNLKAEMTRNGIKQQEAADYLGMSVSNLNLKINGKVPMTVSEITGLKKHFFPDKSIDYLCETDEPEPPLAEQLHAQIGVVEEALRQHGRFDEGAVAALRELERGVE